MHNAIRWIISVKAVVERVEITGKEWSILKGEGPTAERGYTPEIKKTVQREVDVYTQRVDQLQVAAVIAVVNGLNQPMPNPWIEPRFANDDERCLVKLASNTILIAKYSSEDEAWFGDDGGAIAHVTGFQRLPEVWS